MTSDKKPSPVYKLPDGITLEGMTFIVLDHVVGISESTVVFNNGREASIRIDKKLIPEHKNLPNADRTKEGLDKKAIKNSQTREVAYMVTALENWLWYKHRKKE